MVKSFSTLLLLAASVAQAAPLLNLITLHGVKDVVWPRDRPLPVTTTRTRSGQLIAWVHRDHQAGGVLPAPPALSNDTHNGLLSELLHPEAVQGPEGTVPFQVITKSALKKIPQKKPPPGLSKGGLSKRIDYTGHFYGNSAQNVRNWGGKGKMSMFSPHVKNAGSFSLIQIGATNSQLGYIQSAEAGWQTFPELNGGSKKAHIFTYFTTNGYTQAGDNLGGYNTAQAGWTQVHKKYFPGMTFDTISTVGGKQYHMPIQYQLRDGNWWLSINGVWAGYYKGSLYGGANTLGDYSDKLGFWGEVYEDDSAPVTNMGSGRFARAGAKKAAFMKNLRVQTDATGSFAPYDGSANTFATNTSWYTIDTHFDNTDDRGSFFYVGGPGSN